MRFFRVERNLALLLLLAAVAGVVSANTGLWQGLQSLETVDLSFFGISMTFQGWVYNFGLPVFFFIVGLELRREFEVGVFRDKKTIAMPIFAAIFGVAVPALVFVGIVGPSTEAASGWAIPTATDVTFSLAVFMVFGRQLGSQARVFLLAFAIIDDVIAIGIISVLYLGVPNLPYLFASFLAILTFGILVGPVHSKVSKDANAGRIPAAVIGIIAGTVALIAIYLALASGIQTTVIGVVLGLLMPAKKSQQVQDTLHPWVATLVLPLFALFASAIPINLSTVTVEPVFWAVALRPLTKFAGVFVGGLLARRLFGGFGDLSNLQLAKTAMLGGIGFTVSLLVAQLSFGLNPSLLSASVAATLIASVATIVISSLVLVGTHGSKPAHGS